MKSALAAVLLIAACGDNAAGPPDAAPPGLDAPPVDPSVCNPVLVGTSWLLPPGGVRWNHQFTIAGFTGFDGHAPTLYDFATDVDGSVVAAGEFSWIGEDRTQPLARWRDGAWEPALATWALEPPGSGFSAVAIAPDGALALATYDDFGPRSGEIWIDDGTGDGAGLRVIGTFDGLVRTLAWYDGELWVAGWDAIDDGDGGTIQGLAVWDGTGWSAPPGGAPDGFAFELTADGDDLLVGGYFAHVGGIAAAAVARWNGTTWTALDFPGGVGVYALARGPDDELYAGGALGDLGAGGGGLARWTGTAWQAVGGGLTNRLFPGVVTDLAPHAGALYASGCFRTGGGGDDDPGAVVSRDVIRWSGDAWESIVDDSLPVFSSWLEPLACGDEGPGSVWDVSKQRLHSAGDHLFLAGSFPGTDGVQSQAVIAYDGAAWQPQGGGQGLGGSLDHIGVARASCQLWGLGRLSHAGGAPTRARVVHFNGFAWGTIADDLPDDAYCPAFAVEPGGEVAVGCMVFPPTGDAIGQVLVVDGDHLVQRGADLPPVQALAYDADGRLWVGGGGATGFVARFDRGATEATAIEDGFDGAVDRIDPGTDIPAGTDDVLVGGAFTHVGDLAAARIARFDGAAWRTVGDGLPGAATAIAHDATSVYVSTYDEGSGALLLGALDSDGAGWTELATPGSGMTPQPYFNLNAIRIVAGGLVVAGSAVLDDGVGRGALVYAGGTFHALGGGVHAIGVTDLALALGSIWVAGSIAEVGDDTDGVQARPSIGVARLDVIIP